MISAVQDTGRVLYVVDMKTGATTLLDTGGEAIWSPDGREVVFGRLGEGLYRRTVDGPGPAKRILAEAEECVPGSWVEGGVGPTIVRAVPKRTGEKDYEIHQLVWAAGQPTLRPLRATPATEWSPDLSPDGRWLAYSSDESGRWEVYVQSYPEGTFRRQVSTEGGSNAAWSDDGREIFYVAEPQPGRRRRLMSVRVLDPTPLRLSAPSVLFEYATEELGFACIPTRCYDVAPDGQGFFAAARVGPRVVAPSVTHVNLVLNWAEQLKARAPVDR